MNVAAGLTRPAPSAVRSVRAAAGPAGARGEHAALPGAALRDFGNGSLTQDTSADYS
jgi:hypothetical protein